jgi:hypothetical protein
VMQVVGSIRPYDNNPRDNDDAVDAVAASIKEFGVRQPVVVDEQDVIIVGHTRYKTAIKLGMAEVPVHVARGLTPEQARAYRIADNQTATLSRWDEDKLPLELMELQKADFDLAMLGFPDDELLWLLAPAPNDGEADPDEVPEPPDEPITQPGDLWLLGRHRLLCGDATKPEDVARLLPDARVDLLLTDPPYNVAYEGKTADALTIANDDMTRGVPRLPHQRTLGRERPPQAGWLVLSLARRHRRTRRATLLRRSRVACASVPGVGEVGAGARTPGLSVET